jgi:hypothetical protein
MGYYMNAILSQRFDNADRLVLKYNAVKIECPKSFKEVPEDMALVCLVRNKVFGIAAYIFSAKEFAVFAKETDKRPKQWLLMDKKLVIKLTGYKPGFRILPPRLVG